ncbi:MAG: helix-turn-helix transcriptional regulator [Alphaproteobacteria bacterium]|nr:helix-turn-helix transcriptional regulator [Alphaproteobacteria bacterium]
MITGPQLRAARAYLDWTRNELGEACGISPETIKNIEQGRYRPQPTTHDALEQCFRAHDLELVENDGVRKIRTCTKCGWSEAQDARENHSECID